MKSSYLRAGVLACAAALSACGGGGNDLVVGGTIYGLTKEGLVLQINGGSDVAVAKGITTFYFDFKSDEAFEITVKSNPSNAKCEVVSGGKGTTSTFNLTNVVVQCLTTTHKLGGTVAGLGDAKGLILTNGPDQQAVTPSQPAADGSYPPVAVNFAPVAEESPYGVTVLHQPDGKVCAVANGVGTMGTTDITNLQVNCN
ncbi:MAG TPA: hypothetical protein VF861_06740 [Telluria sp.]